MKDYLIFRKIIYILFAEANSMDDLNYLMTLRENANVEFKESANKVPDSFYETYSSFSNTSGGTIYLGIKEGKINEIIGVKNPIEQKKSIISALHSREKVSFCSISDDCIQTIELKGKKIIKISIPEAPKEVKPVYIKGNLSLSYERVGDGDFLLSEDSITNMLFDRRQIRFDAVPNPLDFDFTRVDIDTLKNYRSYLNEISPNNLFKNLNDHDFMERIGALKDNGNGKEVLTNGAVFFFGYINDIMQLSPNFFLDYQENLSGSTRWDYRFVSDDLSVNCNLYNFFNVVSKRLIEYLPNPFKVEGISNVNGGDLKRAVIEAVVNAISNQNYLSLPGLSIRKTQNNINIINSGDILTGVEQAKKGGISEPRNSNIMNYFRIIQVADRAGTGVPSIFDVFKTYQFTEPELSVQRNPTRTILNMSFLQLPMNTPYREEKLKILAVLDNCPDGHTIAEISEIIGKGNTITTQIMNELLSLNFVHTNGKKTKGRLFFRSKK